MKSSCFCESVSVLYRFCFSAWCVAHRPGKIEPVFGWKQTLANHRIGQAWQFFALTIMAVDFGKQAGGFAAHADEKVGLAQVVHKVGCQQPGVNADVVVTSQQHQVAFGVFELGNQAEQGQVAGPFIKAVAPMIICPLRPFVVRVICSTVLSSVTR